MDMPKEADLIKKRHTKKKELGMLQPFPNFLSINQQVHTAI